MKRRKYLAAAIASLVASSLGAATLFAAETPASASNRYTIGDAGVVKQAATNASATTAAHTSSSSAFASAMDACSECGDACAPCDECDACSECFCGPPLWFVEAEALIWWRKSRPLPPLVTTSLPATVQADAGVLGLGSTRTLFGNDNYSDGPNAGGRISFGRWLNADQVTGLGGNFYQLEQEDIRFDHAADGGGDILAIPFVNATGGAEDALLVNFPGVSTNGRVNVQYQNDVLGADAYLRRMLYAEANMRIDVIGGYQFSRVDDGLTIHANYDDLTGLPNANFDVSDSFSAKNEFHGGSIGVLARMDRGRWSVKAIAKCGLGNMHQTVDIAGQTIATPVGGGAVTATPGGLFTQLTNIGSYSNDEFAYIPEGKLNIGYRLTENWTFGVGYSFIYWNDIITAGRAIDRNINLTQIPGPLVGAAVPAPPTFANTSDFWVQGLNLTAEFAY